MEKDISKQPKIGIWQMSKVTRHGAAIIRLRHELDTRTGDLGILSEKEALAFEAAEFIWAYYTTRGIGDVQQNRTVRMRVASAIMNVLDDLKEELEPQE